jgi:C-terminal processing protease CtpA/Prc
MKLLMRLPTLALSLASPVIFAQPSPAVQIGTLARVVPCSTAFPAMASSLETAVAEYKHRVQDALPKETWGLLIEAAANRTESGGTGPEKTDCQNLLEDLVQRRLDAALVLLQEDVQLEDRALRIRTTQLAGFNTIGVRFRFDTLSAKVEDVREESPAFRAGIRPGDIFIEFGGAATARASHARLAILEAPLGATVSIVALRGTQRLHFTALLEVSKGQRAPK